VVYHGQEKWQVSENFTGLFEGPEVLRPYWPDFRYELQDFNQYSAAEVRGNILLRVGILLLIGNHDPNLPERLPSILKLLDELKDGKTALEYLEAALRYLSATAKDISDEQMKAALEEAFKDDGGSIMGGFVEKWIEKGKEEGLQQGLRQGQQEGQQALRNSILDLLVLRFDAAPVLILKRLEEVTDLEMLRQLVNKAATADSLSEFEQYLETIK
jgi:hypothetical protein